MDQNNETNPSEEKKQMSLLLDIGSKLRAARKAMSMSVEDAADHLRVSSQVIQTIESDGYQKEDLDTFTRGYIRSYARLVHFPVATVEKAFEQMGFQTKTVQHTASHSVSSMTVCAYKRRPVYYLLIGVLAFFIVVGYVSHHFRTNNTSVAAVQADQTQPVPSDDAKIVNTSSSLDASQSKQSVDAAKEPLSQPQVSAPANASQASEQDQSQKTQVLSDTAQAEETKTSAPIDQPAAAITPSKTNPVAKPWVDPDAVSDTSSAKQQ